MKILNKTLAGAALASLIVAQPMTAQAAPVRAPAPVQQNDQLHGRGGAAITIVAIAAVLALIFWAAGLFDSSSAPTSP